MMLLDPQKEKADMYDCSCIYVFPGASVSRRRASEEVRARAGRPDCGGRHNTVIILCTDGHTDCLGRRVSMGSWKLEAVLDASCTCKTLGTLDARGNWGGHQIRNVGAQVRASNDVVSASSGKFVTKNGARKHRATSEFGKRRFQQFDRKESVRSFM
jgi:hypothetical protein